MKHYINTLAATGIALLAMTSCEKDKLLTTDFPEAYPTTEITFKVSEVLPLGVGMDSTLVYTVGPESATDKTVIFSSSDPTVATVDENGKITAVKVGEAYINAVPVIGFGANASVQVKVIEKVIKAEEVVVTNTTEPSEEGYYYETDEVQLAYEILPADHTYDYVTWTSMDESIATVDENGLVKCIKEGDAHIRCHTHDHSKIAGDYKFHIYKMQEVDYLEIKPLDGPICINQGNIELDVTYYPTGATIGSVKWESSDPTIADVKRGVITPKGWGTVVITATPPSGKITTINVTVDPGLYIWDPNNKWANWIPSNLGNQIISEDRGDKVWRLNFKIPEEGKKWRGDIKINCDNSNMFPMHKARPVLAIKTNLPKGGDNTWDVRDSGNPHDKNGTDLSDGNRLIMIDLTKKFADWGEEIHNFNRFQLKAADIPYANVDMNKPYYDIYWIRTFASKDEAVAFAEAEITAGK